MRWFLGLETVVQVRLSLEKEYGMKELNGKTAIITGGAEGIGLGIAQVLGSHGMNVVIADINSEQLNKARQNLEALGIPTLALTLDVANSAQWAEVAQQALARFGKVHMLVNNAGVGGAPGPVQNSTEKDWRWIVDVNLMGVVYGAQTVIPLIEDHGDGGWVINVASMAGFLSLPMASAYSATKAAVVALSEGWYAELKDHNIHVAVLCPAFVKTRINLSHRNKQSQYQSDDAPAEISKRDSELGDQMQSVIDAGASPQLVGERVVEAISAKELYIITHPNFRPLVDARFAAINASFKRAESSPLLAEIVKQKIPGFD